MMIYDNTDAFLITALECAESAIVNARATAQIIAEARQKNLPVNDRVVEGLQAYLVECSRKLGVAIDLADKWRPDKGAINDAAALCAKCGRDERGCRINGTCRRFHNA